MSHGIVALWIKEKEMDFWLVSFELDDGSIGDTTVVAVNRIMAYDMMEQIAQEQQWKIKHMEAYKLINGAVEEE